MKKTVYRFQKTKNWKTKFRLVLLIPLIFIIIYITGTLDITGMTGKVTETLTTVSDTIAEDTDSFTAFSKEKTYEDDNKEDSNSKDDDDEDTEDEPAEEVNSIFSILSGSFSSSNSQDDNKQTKTDSEEDEKIDEDIDENICEIMPETIIFIEAETDAGSPPTPQAEFWGTVTVDGKIAEDWLDVKAEANNSIISQAKTCKGYYDISIPDTASDEIKIFINEKYAGTFEWSSGIHNEDLII